MLSIPPFPGTTLYHKLGGRVARAGDEWSLLAYELGDVLRFEGRGRRACRLPRWLPRQT